VLNTSASLTILDPEVRKSAEAGDANAQFRLGEALLQDPAHTVENSADAVRWLQLAAENGSTEAMIVLGRLSRTGVGVLQNFSLSAKWLQTAAARGNPEGMLEMGRLYRDGIGVEKDLVRAYVWFNRASAARNIDAVREREMIARTLTPQELKEAQNQSSTDRPEHVKPAEKYPPKGE
jgi:TPR repeat protein